MHMLGWNWVVAAVASPNPSLGDIVIWIHIYIITQVGPRVRELDSTVQ